MVAWNTFFCILLSLSTTPIVDNSHISAKIYFFFLGSLLKQTWKSFNTKFRPHWKEQKISYKGRQILALFFNLIILLLHPNCVKCLRVTKIVKEIKSGRVWGELQKKKIPKQPFTKYFRLTLVSIWNSISREKLN